MKKMNRMIPKKLRRFVPTFYQPLVFSIPLAHLYSIGVRIILCDLDNTLAAFDELKPSKEVFAFVDQCHQLGFTFIIVSNNKSHRVYDYATLLKVPFLSHAKKPFPTKVLNFLNEKGYDKKEVIIIGDQLLTDVWLAYRLGIRSIFVNPLVPYDHWPTRINRFFEKRIKKQLLDLQVLKPWKE
jgi:HAD superfamily phosphatase (TIGR01668 family)